MIDSKVSGRSRSVTGWLIGRCGGCSRPRWLERGVVARRGRLPRQRLVDGLDQPPRLEQRRASRSGWPLRADRSSRTPRPVHGSSVWFSTRNGQLPSVPQRPSVAAGFPASQRITRCASAVMPSPPGAHSEARRRRLPTDTPERNPSHTTVGHCPQKRDAEEGGHGICRVNPVFPRSDPVPHYAGRTC